MRNTFIFRLEPAFPLFLETRYIMFFPIFLQIVPIFGGSCWIFRTQGLRLSNSSGRIFDRRDWGHCRLICVIFEYEAETMVDISYHNAISHQHHMGRFNNNNKHWTKYSITLLQFTFVSFLCFLRLIPYSPILRKKYEPNVSETPVHLQPRFICLIFITLLIQTQLKLLKTAN